MEVHSIKEETKAFSHEEYDSNFYKSSERLERATEKGDDIFARQALSK